LHPHFFTRRLLTGESLRLDSPILTLRNLAITRAQDEGRRGLGYWYYTIVKAWNFFYTDQELRAIHMGRNERTRLDIEGVPRKMRPDEALEGFRDPPKQGSRLLSCHSIHSLGSSNLWYLFRGQARGARDDPPLSARTLLDR
jgi:hypothetical protein